MNQGSATISASGTPQLGLRQASQPARRPAALSTTHSASTQRPATIGSTGPLSRTPTPIASQNVEAAPGPTRAVAR